MYIAILIIQLEKEGRKGRKKEARKEVCLSGTTKIVMVGGVLRET